ncbi:MAG: PIN domain-containing protein [Thermoplasmata archaeon]
MTLIIDSYAWIEFLTGGRKGPEVRRRLESEDHLLTPDLVLAEVARKFGREGHSEALVQGHLRAITALSDVAPITVEVALQTPRADSDLRAHARRRKLNQPSFADVVILSFARALEGKVLTADLHFEAFPNVEWIGG